MRTTLSLDDDVLFDAYLLALAAAHDGRFVTFDRSLSLSSVYGAAEDHLKVL